MSLWFRDLLVSDENGFTDGGNLPKCIFDLWENRIFLDYSSLFLFPCTLTGMERKHAVQNPCKNAHIYKQYCV